MSAHKVNYPNLEDSQKIVFAIFAHLVCYSLVCCLNGVTLSLSVGWLQ